MDSLYRERKYRRFNLTFPVHVKMQSRGLVSETDAISRNVSVGGVLLESESIIPKGSQVSFTVAVQGERLTRPMVLVGDGNVVRIERISDASFRIAVECTNLMVHEKFFSPLSSQG
jgi:PilZ domain